MNAIIDNKKNNTIEIDGEKYELVASLDALAEITERYDGIDNMTAVLKGDKDPGKQFREIIWIITLFANQPIIMHNYKCPGDPKELLTEKFVGLFADPSKIKNANSLIFNTINKGMEQNIESEDTEKNI